MVINKENRYKTIVYLVLWILFFTAPILSLYAHNVRHDGGTFQWNEVIVIWKLTGIYLAAFLIHHFLLAPLIIQKQKRLLYFCLTAALVSLFALYECNTRPITGEGGPPPEMFDNGHRPPELDHRDGQNGPPPKPDYAPDRDDMGPMDGMGDKNSEKGEHRPPLLFGQHDMVAILVFILMILGNLGIEAYFRQQKSQRDLAELERNTLEQRLEYLKYQLNPHFLMNTLNNIHALVDIDPEQSKDAIIQLSKILRYVLYESNHQWVKISREMEFMKNYTDLMRIRYGNKLEFQVTAPDDGTDASVPPLVFISFVENAFKHGVSYQEPSFIHIEGKRYEDKHYGKRLLWTCKNSKHKKIEQTAIPKQGGVGMENIRQRLDLIYGNKYTLGVNETENTYEVILDIPLEA